MASGTIRCPNCRTVLIKPIWADPTTKIAGEWQGPPDAIQCPSCLRSIPTKPMLRGEFDTDAKGRLTLLVELWGVIGGIVGAVVGIPFYLWLRPEREWHDNVVSGVLAGGIVGSLGTGLVTAVVYVVIKGFALLTGRP